MTVHLLPWLSSVLLSPPRQAFAFGCKMETTNFLPHPPSLATPTERALLFLNSSSRSPRTYTHWPGMGHVPTSKVNPVIRVTECPSWPGLIQGPTAGAARKPTLEYHTDWEAEQEWFLNKIWLATSREGLKDSDGQQKPLSIIITLVTSRHILPTVVYVNHLAHTMCSIRLSLWSLHY